jgi:DNA-binding MarR family transcriptional regulator
VARETTDPNPVMPSFTRGWTFITNHAQVLLAVAQKADLRVREIAAAAGITERYAYRMLRDLQSGGYVERRRVGRCNVYRIHSELAIGDPLVEEQALRELLRIGERERPGSQRLGSPQARRSTNRRGPRATASSGLKKRD